MIRKTMMAGASATLLMGLLFGRDAASYVVASADWLRSSVKSNVPLEFEIERARALVQDLVPEIQENMQLIARQEIEVERLQKQLQQLDTTQANDRLALARLQTDLSTGRETFQYGAQVFTVSQVKTELTNRFDRFKTNDATLSNLQQILAARQKGLEAARQKLTGMLTAKRKLEVDVQNCQSRLQALEAAQTTSELALDDSQLSRAKNLIAEVQTRLDVAAKTVAATDSLGNQIPVGETAPADIADQVAQFLKVSQESSGNTLVNR